MPRTATRDLHEVARPVGERHQRCIARLHCILRCTLTLPPYSVALGGSVELTLAIRQHGLCDAECVQLAKDSRVEQRIGIELLRLRQLRGLAVLTLARQTQFLACTALAFQRNPRHFDVAHVGLLSQYQPRHIGIA